MGFQKARGRARAAEGSTRSWGQAVSLLVFRRSARRIRGTLMVPRVITVTVSDTRTFRAKTIFRGARSPKSASPRSPTSVTSSCPTSRSAFRSSQLSCARSIAKDEAGRGRFFPAAPASHRAITPSRRSNRSSKNASTVLAKHFAGCRGIKSDHARCCRVRRPARSARACIVFALPGSEKAARLGGA